MLFLRTMHEPVILITIYSVKKGEKYFLCVEDKVVSSTRIQKLPLTLHRNVYSDFINQAAVGYFGE